jgi:hypothetical protein
MANKYIALAWIVWVSGTVIAGAQTTAGKIDARAAGAGLVYSGTTAQDFPNATAFTNQEINNLTIDNSAGLTAAGASYLNLKGTLSLLNGNYITANSLYLYGNISAAAGKLQSGSNIVGMFGTAAQTLSLGIFPNNRVGNFYIKNTNGVTLTSWGGVTGTLSLQAGTLTTGGTFLITGSISYTGGGINARNDTMKFAGSTAQSIPNNTFISNTLARLALDNSSGISTTGDLAVTNCFTAGKLKTAVTTLSAPAKVVTITGSKLVVSSFDTPPVTGDVYTLVSAGTLTGTFTSVTLPAGISGTVSYTATQAKLTITSGGSALTAGTARQGLYGKVTGKTCNLDWPVLLNYTVTETVIERSRDGISFTRLAAVKPGGQSFTDEMPLAGSNYYRLCLRDRNGLVTYSRQIRLQVPEAALQVYPNPLPGGRGTVHHARAFDNAFLCIYNAAGVQVQTRKVAEQAVQTALDVQQLLPGAYRLVYTNGDAVQSAQFIKP